MPPCAPARLPAFYPVLLGYGPVHQSRRTPSHSRGHRAPGSLHPVGIHPTPAHDLSLFSLRTLLVAAILAACSAPEPSAAHPATAVTAGSLGAKPGAPAASTTDSTSLLGKADRGRIRGDSSAKLWVVMVSDFQCPYCRQWHDQVFATVMRDYVATGKVRIAYLNFPLSIHQNAVPAAEAAMCASVQGKFWEMHDAIFRTQDQWAGLSDPKPMFDSLATSVGVAPAPFRSCIESNATRPMVLADEQRASSAGVKATPTFFIGSDQVEGAVPLPEFRAALDKALAGAR